MLLTWSSKLINGKNIKKKIRLFLENLRFLWLCKQACARLKRNELQQGFRFFWSYQNKGYNNQNFCGLVLYTVEVTMNIDAWRILANNTNT